MSFALPAPVDTITDEYGNLRVTNTQEGHTVKITTQTKATATASPLIKRVDTITDEYGNLRVTNTAEGHTVKITTQTKASETAL
ncbi:uncharacterized protein I303_100658 [Kwoniella dejecticola CBS 10117]|uniref:Uncharacterized protein n=1 Tax=Kwoniella dejecticola CBS 10117 TaxID=1296121 RepID=A0A1A6AFJ8_9TREE|nr:uncharacterized protein I303_00662 [Kwoniella dejecticola CBS 10117]OBR88845.1 hypothetical protein I303_00662 [Kwoniella dejecticola CBS 10117]